jgi:hypothetical protein
MEQRKVAHKNSNKIDFLYAGKVWNSHETQAYRIQSRHSAATCNRLIGSKRNRRAHFVNEMCAGVLLSRAVAPCQTSNKKARASTRPKCKQRKQFHDAYASLSPSHFCTSSAVQNNRRCTEMTIVLFLRDTRGATLWLMAATH